MCFYTFSVLRVLASVVLSYVSYVS